MPQASFLGCPLLLLCGCVRFAVASINVALELVLLLGRSGGCLFQVVLVLWLVMLLPVALATKSCLPSVTLSPSFWLAGGSVAAYTTMAGEESLNPSQIRDNVLGT